MNRLARLLDDRTLRRVYDVGTIRLAARKKLPRMIFDYIDGGADAEQTVRANEEAFGRWALAPRVLIDVRSRNQQIDLFDRRLASPVLVAPTGLSGAVWPRGELEVARACAEFGTTMIVSAAATQSLEKMAAVSGGNNLWFQQFVYRDRSFTRRLVDRAQRAGYKGLVITVDVPTSGRRLRDQRNGFTIPPQIRPSTALDLLLHVQWWTSMLGAIDLTFENFVDTEPGRARGAVAVGAIMNSLSDPGVVWDHIASIREQWEGPLLIKGITRPDDARCAIDHGVDGVIVSNHGGRQLDAAVPSLVALPAVAEAVAGRVPVLFDGAIRSGTDVLIALALGANAVCTGRAHLWGLAIGGSRGVVQVLQMLYDEIDRALMLIGEPEITQVDRRLLTTRWRYQPKTNYDPPSCKH